MFIILVKRTHELRINTVAKEESLLIGSPPNVLNPSNAEATFV